MILFNWVGSKKRIKGEVYAHFPSNFDVYIEPFLGAAHLALEVLEKNECEFYFLSDANKDLMAFWISLATNPEHLWRNLTIYKGWRSKLMYMKVRRKKPEIIETAAARFYYLVKMSYRGLYRVNSDGVFNAPYGGCSAESFLPDKDLFWKNHELMSKAELDVMDFKDALDMKITGDVLVYLDPPYDGTFSSYTSEKFRQHEQVMLHHMFEKCAKKGWTVIESNSDTRFIRDLYRDHDIYEIPITHNMNPTEGAQEKIELIIST